MRPSLQTTLLRRTIVCIVVPLALATLLIDASAAFAYINGGFKSNSESRAYYKRQEKKRVLYGQRLRVLNAAILRDPNDAVAVYRRGVFFQEFGPREKAKAEFDAALKLDPQFGRALFRRSFVWCETSDWHRALADLDESIRFEPDFATGHFHRALLLSAGLEPKDRNLKEARSSALVACELELKKWKARKPDPSRRVAEYWEDQKLACFCRLLGAIEAELGDFPAAIEWENQILRLSVDGSDERERILRYQNERTDSLVWTRMSILKYGSNFQPMRWEESPAPAKNQ